MSNVFQEHGDGTNFEMRRKASFSRLTEEVAPRSSPGQAEDREKIWKLMETYLQNDKNSIQRGIVNHVEYTLAKTRFNFDTESAYRATAYSVRDRLIESFNDTNQYFYDQKVRRCYYLSLEFLLGRALQNALVNMDIESHYKGALSELGYKLEELYDCEHDPALGNGGLGRLAACFLDSMASQNYPCWGYGIRYTYGIFEQKIVNGRQVEHPDYWLVQDNPWEIPRHDITYAVRFYGDCSQYLDEQGRSRTKWIGGDIVQAMAYDNPIPGFETYNTINLRLWKASPGREFDFQSFNKGNYIEAVEERQSAEAISAVLYPNDNSERGKELRLKQQYFFVCATLQDVLRRFKKHQGEPDWEELPKYVVMQLNDTHPAIAIPELMRILIDIEGLSWERAFEITKEVFRYTNHTVLPEALEKWPVNVFERLLPRHILIINEINHHFITEVRSVLGDDGDLISKMSIYEEGFPKKIRMANLAVIGSKMVNGVAEIHSNLVKEQLFPHFVKFYKAQGNDKKFVNVTNGVTIRRWVYNANPELSKILCDLLGSDIWVKETEKIKALETQMDDPTVVANFQAMKLTCKKRLANWVQDKCGIDVNPEHMLFDVQVKRIHEYKRQLMFCFWILHRYLALKAMSPAERSKQQKRACFIGGKAAPGYYEAKSIIKMTSSISSIVCNDNDVNDYLKVIFLPNYNVSNAQIIIPASDLSEHISTAGMEASGTSNMKFVLNGGLIVGTLDGANVEIRAAGGDETFFLFGTREEDVARKRQEAADKGAEPSAKLAKVLDWIRGGALAQGDGDAQKDFLHLVDKMTSNGEGSCGDYYLIMEDFDDYCRAQADADAKYSDPDAWTKLCMQACARMSHFSSDRTIQQYAENIWDLPRAERPLPNLRAGMSMAPEQKVAPKTVTPPKTAPAPAPIPAATTTPATTTETAGFMSPTTENLAPAPKETTKATTKPTPAATTATVEPTKVTKEATKEETKEVTKEATKDVTKEATKDVTKEATKETKKPASSKSDRTAAL